MEEGQAELGQAAGRRGDLWGGARPSTPSTADLPRGGEVTLGGTLCGHFARPDGAKCLAVLYPAVNSKEKKKWPQVQDPPSLWEGKTMSL